MNLSGRLQDIQIKRSPPLTAHKYRKECQPVASLAVMPVLCQSWYNQGWPVFSLTVTDMPSGIVSYAYWTVSCD